jgi:alpha-tubulin suppressor-like RCC1 family protein
MKKLSTLILSVGILLSACSEPVPKQEGEFVQTTEYTPQITQTEPPATSVAFIPETPAGIISVSTGGDHSMFLDADGNLWVWGSNYNGQIGDGNVSTYFDPILEDEDDPYSHADRRVRNVDNDVYSPKLIKTDVIFAVARGNSSFAITSDNKLYAWGCNHVGHLGDGTNVQKTTPTFIMDDVRYVDSNRFNTMLIKTDDSLWYIGGNYYWSHSGDDVNPPEKIAENVKKAVFDGTRPPMLDGRGASTFAVLYNDGRLVSYARTHDTNEMFVADFYELHDIIDISGGVGQQVFALDKNGNVVGQGANGFIGGALGMGVLGTTGSDNESNDFWFYDFVPVASNVKSLLHGSMLIKNDNTLYVWGNMVESYMVKNSLGVSWGGGVSNFDFIVYGPTPVPLLQNIVSAETGIAVDKDGNVYTWGQNFHGQLGTGDSENRLEPTRIAFE